MKMWKVLISAILVVAAINQLKQFSEYIVSPDVGFVSAVAIVILMALLDYDILKSF